MEKLLKIGIFAVGGYLVINGLKNKRKVKTAAKETKDIPYSKQPIEVQRGEHLSTEEKEKFILENGNISLFAGGEMASADGFTDTIFLESAIKQPKKMEGLSRAMTDLSPANVLKDTKCLISKLKKITDYPDFKHLYKTQVNALYVVLNCEMAKNNKDYDCENTTVAIDAAEKANYVSEEIQKISYKYAPSLLSDCRKERIGGKPSSDNKIKKFHNMVASKLISKVDQWFYNSKK